jgi:sialic acid synthase SpsE
VAAVPIPKGTILSPAMLAFKRSPPGLSPGEALNLIGKVTRVDIEKDEVITWEQI